MTRGAETRALLAPDPAVPRRDALLGEDVVARLFGASRCERVYAKYRVGESLRVVYRLDGEHHVAARTFADSAAAYAKARDNAVPAGPLPPVTHAPDLDAVFWAFPNDRRLARLPLLTTGSPDLTALLGRRCRARVVAYAAERSASARCVDDSGRTVAYVKVHAGDGAERERCKTDAAGPLAPNVLAAAPEHGSLAIAPVEGRRLDTLRGRTLADALRSLGHALAALHATTPAPEERFTRLDPERLAKAVAVIARARPDAAVPAAAALGRLLEAPPDPEPAVCIHGDVNLRNAIDTGSGVVLLDLEHAAAGPAAADLGQLLAGLIADRILGRVTAAEHDALAAALLAGYASVLPPPASLRRHTGASLLARVAQSAVNRVRPDALRGLAGLLEAA